MNEPITKKEKKKNTFKFFIIIFLSALIGGVIGFGTAFASEGLMSLGAAISHGLLVSSPWVLLFFCCAFPLISRFLLRKGSRLIKNLSPEDDESTYDRAERVLGLSLGVSSVSPIFIMTWYGLLVVAMHHEQASDGTFFTLTAAMLISVILISFLQRKAVEQTKLLNPEKRGDALEVHFQKKWLSSMDEQEKQAAYHAGFKAFRSLQITAVILHLFLITATVFVDMGILPFLLVGILWLVPNLVYLRECMKKNQVL